MHQSLVTSPLSRLLTAATVPQLPKKTPRKNMAKSWFTSYGSFAHLVQRGCYSRSFCCRNSSISRIDIRSRSYSTCDFSSRSHRNDIGSSTHRIAAGTSRCKITFRSGYAICTISNRSNSINRDRVSTKFTKTVDRCIVSTKRLCITTTSINCSLAIQSQDNTIAR